MMSHSNSKQKTELITLGFFRDAQKILPFGDNPYYIIPTPIIDITLSYIYNYFMNYTQYTWKVNDLNVVHKMLNAKCGERFYSNAFYLGNIKFKLEVFPNGNNQEREGFFVIYIRLLSLPSTIESIIVLRYFHIVETMASDAWIALLKPGEYDYWGKKCPLSELKEFNCNTITIQVAVNINKIILKENCCNVMTEKYAMEYALEYKLYGKELQMFINSKASKQFNTDIFDKAMSISVYPNGTDEHRLGWIAAYVTICKFPANVLQLSVQYTIKCLEIQDEEYSKTANFSYDELSWGPEKFMKLDVVKHLDVVTFVAELKIVHITKTENINLREISTDMQIKQFC